jgi:hypothetical protein
MTGQSEPSGMTPEAAHAEIDATAGAMAKEGDRHALRDILHPGHKSAVERWGALHEAAGKPSATPEPASARDEIARINAERAAQGGKHALDDPSAPGHKTALERWRALHDAAASAPEPATAESEDIFARPAAPETPAGYNFGVTLTDGPPTDADIARDTQVRGWLHGAGINQGEARALATRAEELVRQGDARHDPGTIKQRQAEGRAFLTRQWGDGFQTKLDAAERALWRMGGEELAGFLENTRLCDDPRTIIVLADAAERNKW